MKSPLLIMSCFVVIVLIVGCESEQIIMGCKSTYDSQSYQGNVKSLVVKSYDVTTRFGEIEKNLMTTRKASSFDEGGKILEETFTELDEDTIVYFYLLKNEYGKYGEKVLSTRYFEDGSIRNKYTYEYDDDCNEVSSTSHFHDMKFITTYEYDEDGNRVSETNYHSDGSYRKNISQYDEDGNKVAQTFYNNFELDGSYSKVGLRYVELTDDSIDCKYTYKHNEEGHLIESIKYYSDGSIDLKSTYEYEELDEKGNFTKETIFHDGVATSILERDFEYYNH